MTAEQLIARLGLRPHPEGGHYRETYRSPHGTAIYYLLLPGTASAMHRLADDEIFHFYLGDPVEQWWLMPDGTTRQVVYGPDLEAGQVPQATVPAGCWQGARLIPGGRYALLGTTMAPPFAFERFEMGDPETLAATYPDCAAFIRAVAAYRSD